MRIKEKITSMKRLFAVILALLFCVTTLVLPLVGEQTGADPSLLAEISKIKAIDDHAHPLRAVGPGEKPDDQYDALTFEEMEPFSDPVRLRSTNPEYISAWQALYQYSYQDMSKAHVRELLDTKRRTMREQGDAYPSWVLDRLGIETMLANRVAMGRGLIPPRFRWVSFDDALIFPLNNEGLQRINPDYRSFFIGEDRLLKRYLAELHVNALPRTLDEYLNTIVIPTLERQKQDGALAVKFEAAYLRSLDFAEASQDEARKIYGRYVNGGEPPATQYKVLQDFLFRAVARECGQLRLAVHIHVFGGGAGSYYRTSASNIMLLDSVFNDPLLRKTNFVIVHGGWPWTREVSILITKPNVYADFSAQGFFLYPRALSEVLRSWLEAMPEKVLFGTDVEPITPEVSWEETGWLLTTTARQALALALTGMMQDGEVTHERALELALMVMRGNAIKLYRLPSQ